jgi:hypothetical protein
MHKITMVLMAGLVLLGIGTILFFSHRGQESRQGRAENGATSSLLAEEESTIRNASGSAETASVAALWGEVVSLRHDIETLKTEISRLAQAIPPGEREPAPSMPVEDHEETKNKHIAMLAKITEEFAKEPSDSNWSSARKSKIRELTERSESMRYAVRNVDCRSRTCRVEMIDDLTANPGENLSLFISELSVTLPKITTDWAKAPDGTSRYILFMSGS